MATTINLAKPLLPTTVDTPLDVRSRIETLDDVPSMQNPVLGGIFYCIATSKHYKITSLQSAVIGGITIENARIGTYEEFGAGSGEGSGTPGQNATVAVGTVTTGQPGTQASVTNSGTSTDAVLNFTIPKGEAGQDGQPGTAATITVGTVTTGAAGSAASVTNSGTTTNAVLNFVIPRGEQGIQGEAGSGGGDASCEDVSAPCVAITDTMPEANGDMLGKMVFYVGETTEDYTHNRLYVCIGNTETSQGDFSSDTPDLIINYLPDDNYGSYDGMILKYVSGEGNSRIWQSDTFQNDNDFYWMIELTYAENETYPPDKEPYLEKYWKLGICRGESPSSLEPMESGVSALKNGPANPWDTDFYDIGAGMYSGENTYRVTVAGGQNAGDAFTWHAVCTQTPVVSGLPEVTSSDNGKVLKVVDGSWTISTAPTGGGSVDLSEIETRLDQHSMAIDNFNGMMNQFVTQSDISTLEERVDSLENSGSGSSGGGPSMSRSQVAVLGMIFA